MEKNSKDWPPGDESKDSSNDESSANAGRFFAYNSVPRYSEEEAQALAKRLDNKNTFQEAMKILISWLESGECNESNSTCFHFLIQLCWNRVEKLQAEEKEYQEEIKRVDKNVLSRNSCIQNRLTEVEEIFSTIEKQNLWTNFSQDHFENIQEMRADLFNFKQDVIKDSADSELQKESDVENIDDEQAESTTHKLQAKVSSLTSKINFVNRETEKMKAKCEENAKKILELRAELEKSRLSHNAHNLMLNREQKASVSVQAASQCNVDRNEAHIVSLISIFLFDHSDGADLNDIYSHLKESIPFTNAADVEKILRKYPNIFLEYQPVFPFEKKVWICISITPETRKLLDK